MKTNEHVYIIAEIANAAQGDYKKNFEIIDAASETRVDAIKFQFYKYDSLCIPSYSKYEIYKNTFYSFDQRKSFVRYAKEKNNMDVWVDIFDEWGYNTFKKLEKYVFGVKIPPTVLFNQELVKRIMQLDKKIAIGVGGYDVDEIDKALKVINRDDVILICGYQGFPTKENEISLSKLWYLKEKYGYKVGFADHVDAESDLAIKMSEYAVCAGADLIEKHIFLDRTKKGYDYYSALHKNEMKNMVDNIRRCESIIGSYSEISSGEKSYLSHAVKATSTKNISTNSIVDRGNISFRRSGDPESIMPQDLNKLLPAKAKMDIASDSGISRKMIAKAKVGIVVLCRLNSTRLSKKALLKLGTSTVIGNCLDNCNNSKRSDVVVLATSETREDRELNFVAKEKGVEFFAGFGDNPARRLFQVAKEYSLDYIVRITGDSPVVSPFFIDYLLSHAKGDYSYYTNIPLGVRSELYKVTAIEKLLEIVETNEYSEYLTLYFKNNPKIFKINPVTFNDFDVEEYKNVRLTVDYPEDYTMLKTLFNYKMNLGIKDIDGTMNMKLIVENDFISINKNVKPKYENEELKNKLDKITTIKK